jgi:hypothetical protein
MAIRKKERWSDGFSEKIEIRNSTAGGANRERR